MNIYGRSEIGCVGGECVKDIKRCGRDVTEQVDVCDDAQRGVCEGRDAWEQEGEQGGEGKERRGEGCLGTRGRTRG